MWRWYLGWQIPLGFDENNLLQINLEGEFAYPGKVEILKETLKKENTILSATEYDEDFIANGGSITGNFDWPGKSAKDDYIISYRSVGYDFIRTIGAKLVDGADFSSRLASDTAGGIILNEAAAKLMALKHPVGTTINWGDEKMHIIGLVNDYNNSIRKVLGADLKSILLLLNKDFIKLVLISNVIAVPTAYALLTNWLNTYDYKVYTGPWPYLMAAGISLTIAILTISMQSFKVAKANPVDALKYE